MVMRSPSKDHPTDSVHAALSIVSITETVGTSPPSSSRHKSADPNSQRRIYSYNLDFYTGDTRGTTFLEPLTFYSPTSKYWACRVDLFGGNDNESGKLPVKCLGLLTQIDASCRVVCFRARNAATLALCLDSLVLEGENRK